MIAANPRLEGAGRANAALIIAIVVLGLNVVYLATMFSQGGRRF